MNRACLICNKEFLVNKYKPNAKYCSIKCRNMGNARSSAKKRGDLQRGRGNGKAYRKLYGRHEHRVVAEQKLGRPLSTEEVVHHINGNKLDNRQENLVVITRSEHGRIHSTKNRICSVEECENKHNSKGYCHRHYLQILRVGKILN